MWGAEECALFTPPPSWLTCWVLQEEAVARCPRWPRGYPRPSFVWEGAIVWASLFTQRLLWEREGEYHLCFYYLHEAHQGWRSQTIAFPEDLSLAFILFIPQPLIFVFIVVGTQIGFQGLDVCTTVWLLRHLIQCMTYSVWIFRRVVRVEGQCLGHVENFPRSIGHEVPRLLPHADWTIRLSQNLWSLKVGVGCWVGTQRRETENLWEAYYNPPFFLPSLYFLPSLSFITPSCNGKCPLPGVNFVPREEKLNKLFFR